MKTWKEYIAAGPNLDFSVPHSGRKHKSMPINFNDKPMQKINLMLKSGKSPIVVDSYGKKFKVDSFDGDNVTIYDLQNLKGSTWPQEDFESSLKNGVLSFETDL